MRARHLVVLAWCPVLALCSCKEERTVSQPAKPPLATPKERSVLDQPLVRLGEHLAQAKIESPLAGLEPDEVALAAKAVLAESFERFSRLKAGWGSDAGCEVVERTDAPSGSRSLAYRGERGHTCVFVVPASPSTYYRVSRAVLTDDANVDLRVIESRVALRQPDVRNHPDDLARALGGRFVRMKDLLYVHRFAKPSTGMWQRHALRLLTTPYTRSLVILVHDADDLKTDAQGREAHFDDLRVERLTPSREQQLALLKEAWLAEGADPAPGMYKHGQLLPIGNVSTVAAPYDSNYDYRYGILAPAPTDISYELRAAGRELRFSMGLVKGSRPGDTVTFRVLARRGGATQTLFEKTVTIGPRAQGWHWHEGRVELSQLGDAPFELVLSTRAPAESQGLAVWGGPTLERPRRNDDPPNVIVLGLDTLRADRLSAYGYARRTSPNLDALAADGVLFSNATSSSNWTSPSFASIFTGVSPSQHQVIHRARAIAPEATTLAEHLQRGGWATAAIVFKAYLYNMGFEQGFDTWFNVPRYDVRADDNLSKALAWLADNHARRFFLFLHFNDPHQPFNQPAPFDRRFNSAADLARFGLSLPIVIEPSGGVQGCAACSQEAPAFRKLAHDLYDGAVAYMDDRIGRLVAELKRRGLYEDTIIAVVGDHGELMWEHANYFGHGGPYMYDELTRVPLIIKPARRSGQHPTARGLVVHEQVRAFDLFPTLLKMVGMAVPEDMAAETLSPLWASSVGAVDGGLTEGGTDGASRTGGATGGARHHIKRRPTNSARDRVAVSENVKQHVLSVRHNGFKLVISHAPSRAPRERLFNLRDDPAEQTDVLSSHPKAAGRLRAHAVRFLLQERPGYYVLVTGPDGVRHSTITLALDSQPRAAQALLGAALVQRAANKLVFRGKPAGHILLLARMDGPSRMKAAITVSASGAPLVREGARSFVPYDGGDVLGEGGTVRVYRYHVAAAELASTRRQKIMGERLEALRALGYIE